MIKSLLKTVFKFELFVCYSSRCRRRSVISFSPSFPFTTFLSFSLSEALSIFSSFTVTFAFSSRVILTVNLNAGDQEHHQKQPTYNLENIQEIIYQKKASSASQCKIRENPFAVRLFTNQNQAPK